MVPQGGVDRGVWEDPQELLGDIPNQREHLGWGELLGGDVRGAVPVEETVDGTGVMTCYFGCKTTTGTLPRHADINKSNTVFGAVISQL